MLRQSDAGSYLHCNSNLHRHAHAYWYLDEDPPLHFSIVHPIPISKKLLRTCFGMTETKKYSFCLFLRLTCFFWGWVCFIHFGAPETDLGYLGPWDCSPYLHRHSHYLHYQHQEWQGAQLQLALHQQHYHHRHPQWEAISTTGPNESKGGQPRKGMHHAAQVSSRGGWGREINLFSNLFL